MVGNTAGSKAFFERVFGWSLTGFGPDYAATIGAGAGGAITRPIYALPGGRRFHFREPSGNELAVYVSEPG